MKKLFLYTIFFSLACFNTIAAEWQKKQAPLMTEWGENINPAKVLQEYPRPQMERREWINLNGVWDLVKGVSGDAYQSNRVYDNKILVPFPIESALSGIMDADNKNADKNYWYKCKFTLPKSYCNKDILLHFGAVDWRSEIFVNGQKVGMHEGGYDSFSFNITPYLKSTDEQELVVRVYDSQWAGGQPHGKQSLNPNGIWYTPVTGIWQTVWLEPVSQTHINDFKIIPDIDKGVVKITPTVAKTTTNTSVVVKILDGSKIVSTTTVTPNKETEIAVADAKLWDTESPFLYNVEFELKEGTTSLDEVKSYFGMRKIALGKLDGNPCIFLNNKPIFQYGVLDQGWWPDGLYTAPSDEALLFDIEKVKEFGFNTIRKHVKTEPARWYYHCDRLGMLVWQDIPNATTNTNRNDWVETNFIREMKNIMNSYKNSPSIITWVVFNEGWGQYDNDQLGRREAYTRKAVQEAIDFDQSRIINGVSGWFDYEIGDMIDRHIYPAPGTHPNPVNHRASVCGEYGGINLKVDNHIWEGSQVNYTTVKNQEELTNLFSKYVDDVKLMKSDGLCGAIYTQVTDVESEINGLITYDRKIVKADAAQTERIRNKIQDCIRNMFNTVIPNSKQVGQQWKYSFDSAPHWYKETFDDSTWKVGLGGFGAGNPSNVVPATEWNTGKICLRRNVYIGDISDAALAGLKISAYYDEDCIIYINGVRAASATGYVGNYSLLDIYPEARAAIRKNDTNLIAVQCIQTKGAQFIDMGFITDEAYIQPSGIENDKMGDNRYIISPNPVSEKFTVSNIPPHSNLQLTSLRGEVVKTYKGSNTWYNVGNIADGIYILSIYDTKQIYAQKLVKTSRSN